MGTERGFATFALSIEGQNNSIHWFEPENMRFPWNIQGALESDHWALLSACSVTDGLHDEPDEHQSGKKMSLNLMLNLLGGRSSLPHILISSLCWILGCSPGDFYPAAKAHTESTASDQTEVIWILWHWENHPRGVPQVRPDTKLFPKT